MIRTLVTPQQQNISILLPKNFVGKQVELIAFTIDEADIKEPSTFDKTLTHFASENSLAKDWLTPQEDIAWKNL